MDDQPFEPSGLTPPSEIGEAPPKPSGWPMTIGVICIVFGSLGLVCYGCNAVSTMATPFMMGMVPEDQRPATPQGVQLVVQVVQLCAAFALSVWLLIAGIGLTRRRPWARGQCIGWSLMKIVLTVISSGVGVLMAPNMVQQINDQMTQGGGPPLFTLTVPMFIAFIVLSLLWYLVWPLFLLIWFSRPAVKAEVDTWAAQARAMI